jgi:hypothetical protein
LKTSTLLGDLFGLGFLVSTFLALCLAMFSAVLLHWRFVSIFFIFFGEELKAKIRDFLEALNLLEFLD